MTSRRRGLLVLTATLALSGCGGSSFADSVPALAQDQTPTDQVRTGVDGIAADSTRYLGGTQVAEYWVGLDGERICLVQSLRATQVLGSSCTDAEEFRRSGLAVTTTSGATSATGLLVPEGLDPADAAGDEEWVAVSDNLFAPAGEGEPTAPPG
ncbi:hypothetical protein [Kineococcus sp. R86509]|uniref:hypothetical protein n=1 Tax=Kineococcus sp. R86509 TaxID=3093851 RepID=UPI0036D35543